MEKTGFDIQAASLRDKLYRYARSLLGECGEAEDAVQDVLERLWQGRTRPDIVNREAFSMTCIRNACLDRLRRRHGTAELPPTLPATGDNDAWTDRELVRRALQALPIREREALHLKEIEGYSTHEVARMLSTDEGQVRVLLSRGRSHLRKELEKLLNYGI